MKKTRKRRARARPAAATPKRVEDAQVRWLLHELHVHSEEITVQNEHLIRAQAEIEQARDRYAELYDFAPVGYLSLDLHGAIHECNFAASALLSRPRRFLLTVPLSALIVTDHRPILREFLQRAMREDDGVGAIEVEVKGEPKRVVRLFAKVRPAGTGTQMLFTAMMDVTLERQLDNERREAMAREQARSRQLASEVAERTRAENRVKALLERLVTVEEGERRRLARELHDELGQQLTALRLTLSMLKQVDRKAEMRKHLEIADRIAARLDHDVDRLAWALRPAALDEFGLVPALDTFVRQWSEHHRIPADLEASELTPRLPGDVENHLYRVVQEALNNVIKHAQATRARITLDQSDHRLRLAIHDNGCGFDTASVRSHSGMGLTGLRERAALIGAEIEIESSLASGTTVTVEMPIAPPAG
jgi:signal transduction histidine kinase